MKEKIDLIVNRLKDLIPKKNGFHKKLFESTNYSLQAEGKRLRPLLTLLTVEALEKDYQIALDPACSIELIHTYSLIHDDLPCMDNDDMRRGKPSLHKVYPEWLAILTGDYLLTYAFEIIAKAKKINHKQKLALIQTLSKYSGEKGLIAGQVTDLSWENKNINLKKLKFMHLNKTASLFIACIEFACIIAKAEKSIKLKFLDFAKNFGLAFQISNDLAGFYKNKSSDIKKKKATAISLLGLKKAKNLIFSLQKKALNILSIIPYDTSKLKLITQQISA